jgi:hypothetical protein
MSIEEGRGSSEGVVREESLCGRGQNNSNEEDGENQHLETSYFASCHLKWLEQLRNRYYKIRTTFYRSLTTPIRITMNWLVSNLYLTGAGGRDADSRAAWQCIYVLP